MGVASLLCAISGGTAFAQGAADGWKFSVMPYGWLPSLDAKLAYGPPAPGGGSPKVSTGESNILEKLDFAFFITGEARRGRWLVATDFAYVDLSAGGNTVTSVDLNPGGGPINVSTTSLTSTASTSLTGSVWTLVGGYAAVQDRRATLDVFGGFRYLDLESITNLELTATVTATRPGIGSATFARTARAEQSASVWSGIVGAKGRIGLGSGNWFLNYYADVGGGSSTFTGQAAAGVGYAFKWGDVVLDYRYLHYSQDGGKLIDELNLGGPAFGANFRF